MLRCLLQRANNLRHSDPLASVTFRGKRFIGDQGVTDTSEQRATTPLLLPYSGIFILRKIKPSVCGELSGLIVSVWIF